MTKKLIYISAKYGGKEENKALVESVIRELIAEDKRNKREGNVYVSPINAFCFLYEETEYEEGLDMTLELLRRCNEIYVLPDYKDSVGVITEIGFAKALGIPITYL